MLMIGHRPEKHDLYYPASELARRYGAETAEPEPPPSPMGETWMTTAFDLLLTDPQSAAKTLSDRASLLVRALSENRLSGVTIDAAGAVTIRSAAGGDPVPWDESGGDAP